MKYKGILSKPRMCREPPGLLASDDDWRLWRDAEREERDKVIAALCDAHKVGRNDTIGLLSALLEAHVPAWREEKAPRGPKLKWSPFHEAALHADVDDRRAKRGGNASVLQACRVLMHDEPWRTLLARASKDPATALSKHYYAADSRLVKAVRQARAYDEFLRRYPGGDLDEALRRDPPNRKTPFAA